MRKKDQLPQSNYDHPFDALDFFQIADHFFRTEPLKQFMDEFDTMLNQSYPFQHIHLHTYETDKNYVINLRIPSVKKEQVKLELIDQYLTISITNREEISEFNENSSTFRSYKTLDNISRTILLPYKVKEDEMKTQYKEGSIVVTIPKKSNQFQIDDDF